MPNVASSIHITILPFHFTTTVLVGPLVDDGNDDDDGCCRRADRMKKKYVNLIVAAILSNVHPTRIIRYKPDVVRGFHT